MKKETKTEQEPIMVKLGPTCIGTSGF